MYIQEYFKSGKPYKSKKNIKSLDWLMNLLENMNESKIFKSSEVEDNFNKRAIVVAGKELNMWEVMKEYGFKEE